MGQITGIPQAPGRPLDGHKGTFGTVIVVGGSATMIGAPALCASGALRAGAGLVKVATSGTVLPFVLTIEPGATGLALGDDPAWLATLLQQADPEGTAILAVGPGLGKSDVAGRLVAGLLRQNRALVLDADGLNLLAATQRPRPVPGPTLVLTPHPGEFARLAQAAGITESPTVPETRSAAALKLAEYHRAIVVLKGRETVVTDGADVYVNRTGNPALATAGSGDVLTGCIAGFMAQGMKAMDAAILGVHVHGAAADLWAKEFGPSGLTAQDLAQRLPQAIHACR